MKKSNIKSILDEEWVILGLNEKWFVLDKSCVHNKPATFNNKSTTKE